jgi:hypothetical protein
MRTCAKHYPSKEKLDTEQRGGGRKFSYTRESNLSRDHIKKATRYKSCERAKKMNKLKDYATRVQMCVMTDLATTTLRKVAILQDHATRALFTVLKDQIVTKQACEYFKL